MQKQHPALALVVIAAAQLMVVLDSTITNIALPSIQKDLEVSASGLSWIVNSYVLAFGGLLLLGGRAGDLYGKRRMFRLGLMVFSAASLLGGLAPNAELLIAARVLQGMGAAVIAPTALSLIATTFAEGPARNRAMGVYAAMAGLGSTAGLLLGGVLTDYLSWRWVMFVNVPIGLAVLVGTRLLASGEKLRGELDVRGAITGTGGLTALVYAITQGGDRGWTDSVTLGMFTIAAVLLITFLRTQGRTKHPLMPLRLLRNRNRAGSYATMLFIGAAMFATFYFLSLYMQQVKGYSPVRTGFAYLPFSVGMGVSAGLGSRLAGRFPPRMLAGPGLVVAAGGMLWFSQLEPSSSYLTHLMPAMFLTALGLGAGFLPMTLGAVAGVDRNDTGIASALLNTAQQIGGAVGLAVLATVSTAAADDQLPHADAVFFQGLATGDMSLVQQAADALTHGYTVAFTCAAGLLLTALVIVVTAVNAGRQQPAQDAAPAHVG
ncbi:EmrB/QacA subfamily drug resistance transporter [Actinoplanes lutulentus]|uniref:EmrB/QacA subfamily drug resistance transporter n=1 Tax=Actinoplanes lutulentus TaxID=1287878 RepID=A0A327Z357_9ACTN|nr:MFS transporter [Actinoplanes lutulentus]MBB2943375.1 EmrB/QacA subfamily drug resistance transporter [Actinoplanes lutulentus]RAK28433.1 EmrB/QacA subfamily drug resistance transporter [Actinoplanes lutulentus]